ncbi:MAG TPA: hypothetical protein VGO19_00205 [Actinomycetes bacterium]
MAGNADPFGTAELRRRVLDAWAASPARFREDANAEEDLVRGGYRDRVVVELAQNAADAATRAGEPGRLRLTLAGDVLVASNTGAPLDAAGVESLSTLRASTKRDAPTSVGRFGVGFAAVLAVTDDPAIGSTTGGVGWHAVASSEQAAALAPLADELARRGGAAPVLRLPWPEDHAPEPGYVTTVVLPLRDDAAVALVRDLLGDVADGLLLALPALAEVTVEVDGVRRVVAHAGRRWRVVRRSGDVAAELVADRPLEERDRPWWSLAWALPTEGQPVPDVLHAPTPTDEALDLPALLVASFPLDTSRRHVAPGPLTDALVGYAAAAYAELAAGEPHPLDLVPEPVPVGRLDGLLRVALTESLAAAALVPSTDGTRVAPRDAVAVTGADGAVRDLLAEALGPLVPDHRGLDRLGGRRVSLAEAVESLAALERPPSWWHRLYTALSDAGVTDHEVLAVLPVPLADGRLVRGPRHVLLPDRDVAAGMGGLTDLPGLRLAHPAAAHPLLLRAGAAEAGPRILLEAEPLRAAVEAAFGEPDPLALAGLVLPLVAAATLRPGELPWLAALPLPDEHGEPVRADELVVAGSPLSRVADLDAVGLVDPELLVRWGAPLLAAVGVLHTFSVVEIEDVVLDPMTVDEPLGGWAQHIAEVAGGEVPDEPDEREGLADLPTSARSVLVVPELDVVAADRWPEALRLLSDDPRLLAAVTAPVRLQTADGRALPMPSYAAWYLREHARLDGRPLADRCLPGSGLDGLYDAVAPGDLDDVDAGLLAAAGVRSDLGAVLAEPGGADDLLSRLGDPARSVPPVTLARVWVGLAELRLEQVRPPERVRLLPDLVVDAGEVVVVDRPEQLQVLDPGEALVVPLSAADRVAALLDLDLGSDVLAEPDLEGGTRRDVPAGLTAVLGTELASEWWEHRSLAVEGRDVGWWRDADGAVHATGPGGLARGLAAATGRWSSRLVVEALLRAPGRADVLAAETRLEG